MKTSGKTWGVSPPALALSVLAAFIILISPVAATLALSDVSFTPNPPMVPAQPQQVSAKIWVIPSGATTFASGHEIQLQTTLKNAQWNIQVIVDGIPAAHQTAQGNVAFINGALIAYSTDRDVSIVVNVAGTVPANAGSSLMVMQIQELDNNGSVVPGSVITIIQPTTVSTTTPIIPTIPVVTPVKTTLPLTSSPTRAPGFSLLGGIGALCIVAAVTTGYYSRECFSKKR